MFTKMTTMVCRSCLKEDVKMISLFAFGIFFGKKMPLKDVLLSCANLQISQNDGFPQTICQTCIVQIEKAYSFRVICEKNQEILKEQNEEIVPCYGDELIESHSAGSSDINKDNGDSIIATGNVDEEEHTENLDKIVLVQNERIDYVPYSEPKSKSPQAQPLQITSKITSKIPSKQVCEPDPAKILLICNICKKQCHSADLYKRHMNFHKTGKQYHCDECDRDFSQQRTYVCHMYSHTGERPALCTECGKTFKSNVALKVHMRAHLNLYPYTCATCGQKLRDSSSITMHKRRHAGEKPYECPLCNKKFITNRRLREHNITHTGEKPFPCNICGKAFARSGSLKVHFQTHTGEKPHICSKCNKGFSQAHCLRSHMKLHEKEVREEKNEDQVKNDVKFQADVIIEEIEDSM